MATVAQTACTLRAWVEGQRIALQPFVSPALMEFVQSLPNPRHNRSRNLWGVDLTPIAAWRVCSERYGWEVEPSQELIRAALAFRPGVVNGDYPQLVKTRPWEHQRQAYSFTYPLHAALEDMGMGTGKSLVTVQLADNWGCRRVLILCPTNVRGVWRREFRRHAARDYDVLVLDKKNTAAKKADQAKACIELAELIGKPTIVVINYETAWRPEFARWACSVEWDLIVCDESHRIKSYNSKSSLFACEVGKRAKRRLCLTGTPMGNSPLDVFGQCRFLDAGLFGTSWPRFRQQYAVTMMDELLAAKAKHEEAIRDMLADGVPEDDPGIEASRDAIGGIVATMQANRGMADNLVKSYRNLDDLQRRLALITFRVGPEVLDLPPVNHHEVSVELSPEGRRRYQEMERDFITQIQSGAVTAANAMVRALRLRQITSGLLCDDMGNGIEQVDTSKAAALAELLEDLDPAEPVVVFACFSNDLTQIRQVAKTVGRRYGELSGKRKDLTKEGEMPEGIDLLGVQIQSGGVGIDLTRAAYAVYFDHPWPMIDYEQSLKRPHRPGQTRPVHYYHLLADGTIDLKVYRALAEHRDVAESILSSLTHNQEVRE